jgi:hypothetical protein
MLVLMRGKVLLALLLSAPMFGEAPKEALRGKLIQGSALETSEHKTIVLLGDEDTARVLRDKRLAGLELEVLGRFTAPDRFQVDPSYTKSLFVLKDGKKLFVTYWCPVCSIRTHVPGTCWCCQQETQLDLRESDEP